MREQSSPIAFAVVGYGRIGQRHASIIRELPDAALCALVDTAADADAVANTGAKADAAANIGAKAAPAVPFFPSLDALLASPVASRLDVVNITTPNGLHAAQACAAMEAGLNVVIEKPMALRSVDAERIIRTAERVGKRVFVVMQNRYSDPARWLKQLIDSGGLGRIFMVQMDCYWNRDQRYYTPKGWHGSRELDGGTLFTQFSHWVDMLYWLFGDITNISARLRDFAHQGLTDFEDSGLVSFDFVGGGMGSLNFSTAVWGKNLESRLTIIAENGSVRIGGQYMERVEYCHGKGLTRSQEGGPGIIPPTPADGSAAHHRDLLLNVVDVLRGRAECDIRATDGWKVVDIIERIYKSV